ncbi:MFS transporter [Schaedlerella sp.]|uniref:MFS transporter n=1 Tax=Schaedlerella sp. TaxID=2676057 RepID=UPI003744FDAC
MAKKPLGKDKFGIQKVMRVGDYFGDSLGQFSLNAISGLVGQLTYFYTDKVGLAAGAVATAFMLTKILDAFTDLIMGNIIDHTKPGKEKYRPWLLKMAVPAALLIILLFTVPANVSPTLQIIYMFLTNFLLTAVIYTAIAVPYSAIQVVRTASQEERGTMGTFRAAAGYVSGMIIAVLTIPLTNILGGDQGAWIKYGFGFGLAALLCLLLCYARSKETNPAAEVKPEEDEEEQIPFGEAVGKLFRNKYWVMVLVLSLCANVTYGLANSAGTYYAKWIYGNDNLIGIQGAIGMIPTLLGFILVGPMIKKMGVTKTLRVSFFLGMAANVLRLLNPYHFWMNTILGCFGTFSNIPMMCLLGVLTAMSIDYNEYQFGQRMVARSQSAASFGCKVGTGVGASLVGWCLGIASYDPNAAALTAGTKYAIFTFNIYIPIILFAVMFFVSLKFDLEKRMPEIHAKIAERKAAAPCRAARDFSGTAGA